MNKTTEALKLAEEALSFYVEDFDCAADVIALTVIREAKAELEKQEPVSWINEDELPEHYPYEEMFNASTIIDGVRMFPNVKMSARSMFYGLTKDHTWLSVTESQFNKLKPEKRMKCYLTPVDAKAIRAEALEEAAKVCEQIDANNRGFPLNAKTYAAAIRSLKEKP